MIFTRWQAVQAGLWDSDRTLTLFQHSLKNSAKYVGKPIYGAKGRRVVCAMWLFTQAYYSSAIMPSDLKSAAAN
jgi:hypothetical protein